MVRRAAFGVPISVPRSVQTTLRFTPTLGYTELPDVQAPPTSLTSAANMWVRQGRLAPRWRWSSGVTNNVLNDVPVGAFLYHDVAGNEYPVVASEATVAYCDQQTMIGLTYVPSGVTNEPPSGGENDLIFGTSVYLERRDVNIAVFVNGVDYAFAAVPSVDTQFSTLTGAPIAKDVALLDNRVVFWNVRDDSALSRFVTRAQWSVRGDPEDYSSTGAGFEDLVDMHGQGTRIFAEGDQLILATEEEIWRGRKTGLDVVVLNFTPLERNLGIPYPRAATQTPLGIVWLGSDRMIYRLSGERIEPIGANVQRTLRDTLTQPQRAFFGYNPETQQLTLYYQTDESRVGHALTLHPASGVWTPHTTPLDLRAGLVTAISSSATTWGALVGAFTDQTLSYEELLGVGSFDREIAVSSVGSVLYASASGTSDHGQSVEGSAVLGGLMTADSQNLKYVHMVRADVRATSASSLSLAVSGNLGGAYAAAQEFAVSVQSASTQIIQPCGVSGAYFALQLRSEEIGWEVNGLTVHARYLGPVL